METVKKNLKEESCVIEHTCPNLVNKGQQMPIVIDKEILNNRGVLIHVKPRSHHHQNGGHHHSSNKHHGSSKHHQNGGGGSHHKHHHNKNKHHHHRSRKDRIKAESSALVTPGMLYNQTKKLHTDAPIS